MVQRLVVLGAGGHAKMVIEAARSQGRYEPAVCLTHGPLPSAIEMMPPRVLGVEVALETDDQLQRLRQQGLVAFAAVGDNALRRKLCAKLERIGFELATIVASNAWLSPSAQVGSGTVLMPGSVVGAETKLGQGVIVNTCASVDHDCRIAAFAHIAPGVHLAGNVQLGEETFLGVGASVIPEKQIGARVTIGSGAVVVSHVPDDQVWIGCPARHFKRRTNE